MASVIAFLRARQKAIAALLVPLIGGTLAALWPDSNAAREWGVIVAALVAAGVVHQVPNKSPAPSGLITSAAQPPKS